MPLTATPPNRLLVELCAGGIEDVILAAAHEVDRIELNSGMTVGGLTPSAGLVAGSRKIFSGPIIAMVRPREGGFAYSKAEYLQMLNDSELLLDAGLDGIATGFLTSAGTVDVERCRKLRTLLPGAFLVFHKAFDVTEDPDIALSQLIECGFNRILTSGGMPTAIEGAAILKRLHEKAVGRIEILPAGSIRASNVLALVSQTACDQIHSAVRGKAIDLSTQRNSRIQFGLPGNDSTTYGSASANQLQELLCAVQHLRLPESGGHGS